MTGSGGGDDVSMVLTDWMRGRTIGIQENVRAGLAVRRWFATGAATSGAELVSGEDYEQFRRAGREGCGMRTSC